jgi:hypothetical protein
MIGKRKVAMLRIAIISSLVVLIPLVAFLAYAATRPSVLNISRSTIIQAPPEQIFPLINDFHHWVAWSPYEKKDLTMKRLLSGADQGTGARYAWNGNQNIGEGSMEILESLPPSQVTIQLTFVRPFKGQNVVVFALKPQGQFTEVTWDMSGPNTYLGKIMGLLIDMDKMIGNDFEAGLASLKALAEQPTQQPLALASSAR